METAGRKATATAAPPGSSAARCRPRVAVYPAGLYDGTRTRNRPPRLGRGAPCTIGAPTAPPVQPRCSVHRQLERPALAPRAHPATSRPPKTNRRRTRPPPISVTENASRARSAPGRGTIPGQRDFFALAGFLALAGAALRVVFFAALGMAFLLVGCSNKKRGGRQRSRGARGLRRTRDEPPSSVHLMLSADLFGPRALVNMILQI